MRILSREEPPPDFFCGILPWFRHFFRLWYCPPCSLSPEVFPGLCSRFAVIFRFQVSLRGIYVLLTGLFCGCPMGAKTCADFLTERISPGEARFLFALCNHQSPMFLTGFVFPMFAAVSLCPLLSLRSYAASAACHSGIPDLPKRASFPAITDVPFSSCNPKFGDASIGQMFSLDTRDPDPRRSS